MVLINQVKIPTRLELIKSLPSIRREWKYKTPLKKWSYVYGIGKEFSDLIGLPPFNEDQTVHWYSYLGHICTGYYAILVLYTAFHWISLGEPLKCLPCTCLFCGLFNSILYVQTVIYKNRDKYCSLVRFGGQYIYPDNNDDTQYNRICSEQMNATAKSFFVKAGGMLFGGYAAIAGPVYAYFWLNYKTTTTELKFPFIDDNSNAVFLANITLQFFILLHGTCILFGVEIMMSLFQNVANITPKLIEHELHKLCNKYERKKLSNVQLRFALKNIEKQILDYDSYMTSIKDFQYLRFWSTPCLYNYAIAVAIFCHMKVGFIAGYGFAFLIYVQMYFLCDCGDQIEDNKFAEILYGSQWETLPFDLQKDLIILISRQQNAVKFTEGPFRTINRELFKIVTNKIYSLIMFLLNFTD